MVFTNERGRIGKEFSKNAIYRRNYRLKNLEKIREKERISAKKFYDKNRADKTKMPNFNCIICKNLIEDNPKGRKFKCIECKFKERADKNVKDFEDRKRISRQFTLQILKPLKLMCEKCKEKNKRLEFHHKIYPLTAREIIQAYNDKKIIPLCRKHHIEIHKCRNTDIQNTND